MAAHQPASSRVSAWNFDDSTGSDSVGGNDLTLTFNPSFVPSVIERFEYAHPIFDSGAIEAQRELPLIQGTNNTWFCGAWSGYGFHEDGLRSALDVVNGLGVTAPWQQHHADELEVRGAA